MKKFCLIVVCSSLLICSLTACGKSEPKTVVGPEDIKEIEAYRAMVDADEQQQKAAETNAE